MSPSDRTHYETQLARLSNDVLKILKKKKLTGRAQFCCLFDPAADMPYIVRIGETQGECIDIDGYEPRHALAHFSIVGVARIKSRLPASVEDGK